MSDTPATSAPQKRRWRFQFSLRTLLLFVLAWALFMAWFRSNIDAAKKQRDILDRLQARASADGTTPRYYYADEKGGVLTDEVLSEGISEPFHAPQWLMNLLGRDFFSSVKVIVTEPDLIDGITGLHRLHSVIIDAKGKPLTKEHIEMLARLPELKVVAMISQSGSELSDDVLVSLADNLHLEGLQLVKCQAITSRGLTALGNLHKLKVFTFQSSPLDDDFIATVAKWPALEFISFINDVPTGVAGKNIALTSAGVKAFCELPCAGKLKCICFWSDGLSDELLEHVHRLLNLQRLGIQGPISP
jgi:hypothetical protein